MMVALNYKKELEQAARTMILIHDPQVLVKMIVRTIVRRVGVIHAGILLYKRERDIYELTVSRGKLGFRLPPGFLYIRKDSAMIRFFLEKHWDIWRKNNILLKRINAFLRSPRNRKNYTFSKDIGEYISYFRKLKEELFRYQTLACIPSFFGEQLVGLLLLGRKKERKEFSEEELDFLSALASDVAMAVRNAQLFEDLIRQVESHRNLFYSTIFALASAIEAKDKYTRGHTQRVTEISLKIAQELFKDKRRRFPSNFLESVRIAALLHDIGKIGVPEKILNKKSPLNPKERKIIEKHPEIGASIIEPIRELREIREAVKYHHQRYDGDGYPAYYKGKGKIPFISAIISCADAYDAMTSDRPYRKALNKDGALREIKKERGKQFHPQIVDVFLRLAKKNLI